MAHFTFPDVEEFLVHAREEAELDSDGIGYLILMQEPYVRYTVDNSLRTLSGPQKYASLAHIDKINQEVGFIQKIYSA
ncbi:MAG: hypothetical protein WC916_05115 [Candidatus Woesearchaeota archaeon]